jgi:ABC-type glycerol-3-phosphate transport system permease component
VERVPVEADGAEVGGRGQAAPAAPRRRRRLAPLEWLGALGLCGLAVVFLHPLLWLSDSAFRSQVDMFAVPPVLVRDPVAALQGYQLRGLEAALGKWGVGQALAVSILVTILAVGLTLLVCSLCAYAFAYLDFRGRDAMFVGVLGLMMLPMATMIVPTVTTLRVLHLIDNLGGLVLPYAMSPLGVFLLRQYYIKIPRELFEAARIDGAGHLRIWWSLIVPLSKPAMAALATFQLLWVWNDFLLPMLVLRSDTLHTLPLRVAVMLSVLYNPPWEAIMATGFIAALLPLVLFLRYQRQFIEGLMGARRG